MTRFATILVLVTIVSPLHAQQPPPTGTLSTDKGTYQTFEPIIVTASITNTSGERQPYGLPSPAPRLIKPVALFLVTPRGDTLSPSGHWLGQPPGDRIEMLMPHTLNPGDTRERIFNPLLTWAIWDTGTYSILIEHGVASTTTVATVSFDVVEPAGVDSTTIAIAREAATAAFTGFHLLTPEVESRLDSLASLVSLPQHMREFMRFSYAVAALTRNQGQDSAEATSRYDAFKTEYSGTSYQRQGSTLGNYMASRGEDVYGFDIPVTPRLKLFLEGSYNASSGMMETDLTVPLREPYEGDPWFHTSYPVQDIGAVGFTSQVSNVVDYVLVGLFDSLGTKVDMVATQLQSSGRVAPSFINLPPGRYQVIVDHRNHLAVASDSLVNFTTGYAEHDFTTGAALGYNPQKQIISGQDTVYAMWAADADADGMVTGSDFDLWLRDTRAVVTGYVGTDFNMNAQVTATDYNMWLFNSKAAASSPTALRQALYPGALDNAPFTGQSSETAPKTSTGEEIDARYLISGRASQGLLYVTINVRTDPGVVDTLGSVTFDVYYNSAELFYGQLLGYQPLLDAGYSITVEKRANEHGSFVRVMVNTWNPESSYYEIKGSWSGELLQLRFYEYNGPITSHDVAFNLATMSVALISDGVVEQHESIIPIYKDQFHY